MALRHAELPVCSDTDEEFSVSILNGIFLTNHLHVLSRFLSRVLVLTTRYRQGCSSTRLMVRITRSADGIQAEGASKPCRRQIAALDEYQ